VIEFSPIERPPESARDAIVDFIDGFEASGFRILDFQYLDNVPPVADEPVTMAYAQMYHPDYDTPPDDHLIAAFRHGSEYHLLWAHLIASEDDADFQHLYDTLIGLIEGMSFGL